MAPLTFIACNRWYMVQGLGTTSHDLDPLALSKKLLALRAACPSAKVVVGKLLLYLSGNSHMVCVGVWHIQVNI